MTTATTPPLTDGISPSLASRPDRLYPTLTPAQSRTARLVILADRGRYVRNPAEYERLAAPVFEVETAVRSDLLRIPYTHCILECTAGGNRSQRS